MERLSAATPGSRPASAAATGRALRRARPSIVARAVVVPALTFAPITRGAGNAEPAQLYPALDRTQAVPVSAFTPSGNWRNVEPNPRMLRRKKRNRMVLATRFASSTLPRTARRLDAGPSVSAISAAIHDIGAVTPRRGSSAS